MLAFVFFVAIGYLMGSLNAAILVSRFFSLPDPRAEGSKNPGATNVLRLAGKQYASLVMLVDLLKGLIPVVLAQFFNASPVVVSFTAFAAVLGHMYPVFFEFKGGKGVATSIGALLAFHLSIGILVALTWLLVAKLTRYSSLASIVSICLAPLFSLLLFTDIATFPALFLIALFVLFKHAANISRLILGKEHKIKLKPTLLEDIIPETTPTAHEISKFEKETKTKAAKKTPSKDKS